MCGLAGFINPSFPVSQWKLALTAMGDALAHRGPDDSGIWLEESSGIGLSHRRLAIQDLSQQGHQPMVSNSSRYVIAYNGEVYNFLELRKELEKNNGMPENGWRGQSDTEILLACIERWGLSQAIQKWNGMFAFALWDRQEKTLTLARDRLGIKPLYYGQIGSVLVFGSELKSLRAFPGFSREVNRSALQLLLRHGFIPSPHCIYRNVYKLPPGTTLTLHTLENENLNQKKPVTYWQLGNSPEENVPEPFSGSFADAVNQLEELLKNSVNLRMISDAPLGAFLSGGIDSSLIVALMQNRHTTPIKTFSIGFQDERFNEGPYAKAIANHLRTDHTELTVTPQMAQEVIPQLPTLYDEPFGDYSQIPTFLVSRMTREHVTVSLSGDGGDELFFGYNRYFLSRSIYPKIREIPLSARNLLSKMIMALRSPAFNPVLKRLLTFFPPRIRQAHPAYTLYKLAQVIAQNSPKSFYQEMISHWSENEPGPVLDASRPDTIHDPLNPWVSAEHFCESMMTIDQKVLLPDDILTKLDRASMGTGLEARVPLLDHRIVEFAKSLPFEYKFRNGSGKAILKQLLRKYVPDSLFNRPKVGFSVPIGDWLSGSLREWVGDLLNPDRLKREGYLNPRLIQKKWREHLTGTCNWQYHLWNVLMFQAWLEKEK